MILFIAEFINPAWKKNKALKDAKEIQPKYTRYIYKQYNMIQLLSLKNPHNRSKYREDIKNSATSNKLQEHESRNHLGL